MNRGLYVLAGLLLTCAALAAPVPQPFVAGWGSPIDPDKDCKITGEKGILTIEMPGGDHDYDTAPERPKVPQSFPMFPGRECAEDSRERLNAPRLVREFEGDFEIQIRVRIDALPSAKSSVKGLPSFVAAGFVVIPPDTFWKLFLRFQYGVAGAGMGADGFATQLSRDVKGGSGRGVCDKSWKNWPFKDKPEHVYVRLERKGELLLCKISADSNSWVTIGGGTLLGLPPKLKVGLASFSTSTEPSKVRFDQLKITRDRKKK